MEVYGFLEVSRQQVVRICFLSSNQLLKNKLNAFLLLLFQLARKYDLWYLNSTVDEWNVVFDGNNTEDYKHLISVSANEGFATPSGDFGIVRGDNKDVWIFDMSNNTWRQPTVTKTKEADLVPGNLKDYCSTVDVDGNLWIYENQLRQHATLWRLDSATLLWTSFNGTKIISKCSIAVDLDKNVIVFGGITTSDKARGLTNELNVFNGSTWETINARDVKLNAPSVYPSTTRQVGVIGSRAQASMFVGFDNNLYVYGGQGINELGRIGKWNNIIYPLTKRNQH